MKRIAILLALSLSLVAASTARAESTVFSGIGTNSSSGHSLKAEATFDFDASNHLVITLKNIATQVSSVPSDLLTGIFFDIVGLPSLTSSNYLSAVADTVVQRVNTGTKKAPNYVVDTDNNVAVKYPGLTGGWSYASNTSSALVGTGQHYGFGTAGFGVFGGGGGGQQFPYGIVNPTFNALTDGNPAMRGKPFVKNTVTFTLSGLAAGFNPLTQIKNVRFQYGTSLDEPTFAGSSTPEPSSFALMGIGLVGLGFYTRRRKQAAKLAA